MKNENVELFLVTYGQELLLARQAKPEDYAWPLDQFDDVLSRMSAAILRGSFNKDSHAIKATCKKLKIKHTYAAIREFLGAS